jgi:hypothetical protein
MGNKHTRYDILDIDTKEIAKSENHKLIRIKRNPYNVIINRKIKGEHPNGWSYFDIHNLKDGKFRWRLNIKLNRNYDDFKSELNIVDDNNIIMFSMPLHYSSKSDDYRLILKSKYVKLELHADNIHSQRLHELKLSYKFKNFGFIQFENEDKIPIAF